MKVAIEKVISGFALMTAMTGQAHATLQSGGVIMNRYDGYTPISQQGNSFTFAFPEWAIYDPNGNGAPYIERNFFQFAAVDGYALTGGMRLQINTTYDLVDHSDTPWYPNSTAQLFLGIDVIKPREDCEFCSPYEGTLLGSAGNSVESENTSLTGALSVNTGNTPASGAFSSLYMYEVFNPSITTLDGIIRFDTITFTVETTPSVVVPPNPIPEPSSNWLMLCGMGIIGALMRRREQGHPAA